MATVTSTKRHLGITSDTYDSNGDVVVGGNLTVEGTTTTLDTANLLVEDKNIIIGNVSSPSDTTADGGGITLKGASDYTINWVNANDRWEFNQGIYSSGPITSAGQITGTELEGTSLDINGNADISGVLTLSKSNGSLIATTNTTDAFGYNATAGKGHYIKGTAATYIYGGGTFFDGTTTHTLLHDGSTISTSQITNLSGTNTGDQDLSGYLTEYIETDTLASVTGRGASTTSQLFFDGGFDSHPIMLSGAQNFDNIDRSGFYNLYNTHTSSTNSPGFPYGTMIAIGNDKGSQSFGLQIAHERTGTGMYVRGMNDTASTWSAWAEIWTSTTDGAGSGLDADKLDGQEGTHYLDYNNFDNTPTIPTDFVSAANGGTFGGGISVEGNILLTGTPTTTNQSRMIDFTGFDKEGTTDPSDRAYIRHTVGVGGHAGSVLEISSQNDSGDGIAFTTNAASNLKHNNNTIWTSGNDGAGSGLDADTLDTYSSVSFARKAESNPIFTSGLSKQNSRHQSGVVSEYPLGHYTPGDTLFEIDPTWSDAELKSYFNNTNVSWDEVANAPGGYAVYINGSVGVGGVYGSGFPMIPIDEDATYYQECWIKNATASSMGHYMGSNDYEADFTHPASGAGNPGSYGYWVMSNQSPGNTWTKVSGYITGHHASNSGAFETDATYFSPLALFNYSYSSGTRACWISGWKIIRVDKVGDRIFQDDVQVKGKLEVHTLDTNTTSATALVMNTNEVEKRTLGTLAFSSATIPTDHGDHDGLYLPIGGGTLTGPLIVDTAGGAEKMTFNNEFNTAPIADTFTGNTSKSYITFGVVAGSNDPGFIMHESSATETNEGVIHLVPSDDNTGTDYVSIHGTNDPDSLRLYTSGLIETATNIQLQLQSGLNAVFVNDDIRVVGNIHLDSDSAQLQLGDDNDMQIFHNGTNGEINNATGNFTIDSAGDIILDAAGDSIQLTDNGTLIGKVNMTSQNLTFISSVSNKDMIFRGNDNGTFFTAFSLDMSEAGTAAFSNDIVVNGDQIRFINDAASSYVSAADALFLQSDYNTGENKPIYLQPSAVTELVVATGKSTFVGDVGIGTTSPSSKLEVYASGSTVLDIQGSQGQLFSITDDLTGDLFTVSDISGVPIFNVNASGTSYFDDKVGIGETSPSHKIDIKQGELRILNNQLDPQIILQGSDMGKRWVLSQDEEDNIGSTGFYIAEGTDVDANDALLYLTPTGELGIGTTSPNEKLQVGGKVYIESQGVNWNETTPGTTRGAIHLDPVGDGADNTGNAITFGASDRLTGTNAQAGIYTRSDGAYGTKMYFATTDSYTAGSKTRMMIDYNGNVGIGTTSPAFKLHVDSSEASDNVAYIHHNNASQTSGDVLKVRSDAGDNEGSALLNIGNNSGSGLYVRGDRKVGIGTAFPKTSLTLGTGSSGISFQSSSTTLNSGKIAVIKQVEVGNGNGHLTFETYQGGSGGGERMRILNDGKVGIGTTSPATLLHTATPATESAAVNNELRIQSTHSSGYGGKAIVNLVTSQYGYSGIYMGDNTTFSSQPSYIEYVDSSNMLKYKAPQNHTMLVGTATKMSMNTATTYFSGNNVGIGTTSPSHQLEVGLESTVALANQPAIPLMVSNDGNNVDGRVFIQVKHDVVNTAGAIAAGFQMTAAAVSSGTPSYFSSLMFLESAHNGSDTVHSAPKAIKFYVDNHDTAAGVGTSYGQLGDFAMIIAESTDVGIGDDTPSYKLDVAGTIRATGDVIAFSDRRVKENIKTIENASDKVLKLRGVEYNKIGETKKSIGVIAQEIEEVLPEVVSTDTNGMKSVAYGNITGVLIEAIKELKAEIEELKKQIK